MTGTPLRLASTIGLLGTLYLSQGLPFGFFTQALPVVLRDRGWSLGQIGLTSLLAAPWALKFLWAPLVDRYGSRRLGRRRSWILPLQALAVLALVVAALPQISRDLSLVLGAVALLNLIAATQDVATDGLAVDLLGRAERGLGNGVQVASYRVGMILGGGLILIVLERLGWSLALLLMAALLALATIPVLRAREPAPRSPEPSSSSAPSLPHFFRRPGAARLLAIVVIFKLGDALAGGMVRPLLHDLGLGLDEIGLLLGVVGFVAGLLGALAGGALVNRLGRRRALLLFGLAQSAAVGGYALAATGGLGSVALGAICALEHLAGGMATAALFTCMMDWCRPGAAATDYTVQASAVVVATGLAATVSGFSAQALGYTAHFVGSAVLSVIAALVAAALFPHGDDRSPRAANAAAGVSFASTQAAAGSPTAGGV